MRVCMLVRNPCVRDARVLREARALTDAGWDLTILATQEPGLPIVQERDGFVIQRVAPVPDWVRRVSRRAPIPTQNAQAPRTSSDPKGRPQWMVAARDQMVTHQFSVAARATPADVYHAHDLNTLAAGVRAASRHRARLVYDAHELYPELTGLHPRERARWSRLEHTLIRRADVVITPSNARADEMARRYGIARPRVIMNCPPAGPTPDRGAGPLAALRRETETLIVYAGGYTVNRGLENVLRALKMLRGCHLAMMGYGSLEPALRALVAQENLGNRVTFVPPVDADSVVAAVAAADIGIVSYLPIGLNNKLAAPNKLWEYLHAGLAVAASDLPEIRAFVEQYEVGALFDSADPISIARAIQTLADDRAGVRAMQARAAEIAPRYTWESQAAVLNEVYNAFR